jgi:ketosteroid isomerase-like protein
MKRNCRFVAAAAIVLLLPICVPALADDGSKADREKTLEDTVEAWSRAIEEKDKAAMRLILADDFLNIDVNGKTWGKEESIAFLAADNLTLGVEKRDNEQTRVYDDTAVMTARVVFAVEIDGKQVTLEVRDIHCWVHKDKRWQLSIYQQTQVQ